MRYHFFPAVALAGVITLSACGSDDESSTATTTDAATTVAADTAPDTAAETVTASSPAGSAPAVAATTVDANTATADELVSALEANGVSNADRWADEVMEYRPYDTADPTLAHLRDELAKYNPDAATLEAIIASLTV